MLDQSTRSHEEQRPLREREKHERYYRCQPDEHLVTGADPRHGARSFRSKHRIGASCGGAPPVYDVEPDGEAGDCQRRKKRAERLERARESDTDAEGHKEHRSDATE